MKKIFIILCAYFSFIMSVTAEKNTIAQAEVMMLGVFHFSSPGNDAVKVKHLDAMNASSQAYLEKLSIKIANQYKPTLILLEYSPRNDKKIQDFYKRYQNNDYTLPVNEIFQLGFRIAKAAGNIDIASFDDRRIGWAAERLFETMPKTAPLIKKASDEAIKRLTEQGNIAHATMSFSDLLLQHNDPERDKQNKAFYLLTNQVSTNGEFEGALASSSWWHRNFRMYAKIQQYAKNGDRILVIGGQGHTAILKDFLAIDENLKGVDVRPYL